MPANERHVQQQRQADGAAEKLGEIGRHGGNLADRPHRQHHRTRKMIAAHFRKVLAGDDAELGGQALEQHGDDVGEQHDPEQAIAVFGAGLDVGGEIARVHIGDRGDDRRAGKRQRGAQAPALARQHLARGDQRPVGQRSRSTGLLRHGERFIEIRHDRRSSCTCVAFGSAAFTLKCSTGYSIRIGAARVNG